MIFAALGDDTRLSLIDKLFNSHGPQSISQLAAGSTLTRQAITKHLHVLEGVGVLHHARVGRERLFAVKLEPFQELQAYLDRVSGQWEDALVRLQFHVERGSV